MKNIVLTVYQKLIKIYKFYKNQKKRWFPSRIYVNLKLKIHRTH